MKKIWGRRLREEVFFSIIDRDFFTFSYLPKAVNRSRILNEEMKKRTRRLISFECSTTYDVWSSSKSSSVVLSPLTLGSISNVDIFARRSSCWYFAVPEDSLTTSPANLFALELSVFTVSPAIMSRLRFVLFVLPILWPKRALRSSLARLAFLWTNTI